MSIWIGQSKEDVYKIVGHPVDIDVLTTRDGVTETWKYNKIGDGKYALRITIKNGKVYRVDDRRDAHKPKIALPLLSMALILFCICMCLVVYLGNN